MEPTVEQPPDPLTTEKAQAMAILMQTAAKEFGPIVQHLVHEARAVATEAREANIKAIAAGRELDARESEARREHERRGAWMAITLQAVIMVSVAVGTIVAMANGQWAIAEKAMFGLLGLGFGARLAR